MSKSKKSFIATAVVAAAASAGHAAIISLGTSQAAAPTAIPTITVAPGGQFTLDLWGQAQGTGFVSGISMGLYQSSAASFNGGLLSATNTLPAATLFSGAPTVAYASGAAAIFNGGGTAAPSTAAAQPTGSSGSLVVSNIGGNMNTSSPPAAASQMTSTQAQFFAAVTGTATMTPGTYYVYLGRSGTNGVAEFPNFKAATFIGNNGTGSAVSNTALFGTDDSQAVATAGIGTNGASNNVLSPKADAIIVVQQVGATISLTTPALAPVTTIPGSGVSYQATLLNTNDSFALGGTPAGDAIAGFDFSGDPGPIATLPTGASILTGAAAAPYIALFNKLNGGSFDTIVDLGPGNTSGNLVLSGLPSGVTLNAVAVVPEPTTISLVGIGAVLAMNRRRRQA
jgi:hypothetical protein